MPELNPKPGELYRHKKGEVYRILHIAKSAWDSDQYLVIYQGATASTLPVWARFWSEFCDGRFSYFKPTKELH